MDATQQATAMTPSELAEAWRALARRGDAAAGDAACARIDALADAGALQATYDAAEGVEPDAWEGLAELRAAVAADAVEALGCAFESRLLVFGVAGPSGELDALPRDRAAWRALRDSLEESGLFRPGAAVHLRPVALDPVALAELPLDDVRDLARHMGRLALAQAPSERAAAEAVVERILSEALPGADPDTGGAEVHVVRAFVGVRVQQELGRDDAGDLLDPGDGFDEPRARALASAWQAEAFVAVGDRGIDAFSAPAPWEDAFMTCGVMVAALWISMEEELDPGVPEDGTAEIHACPDPERWGMLVSRVRHGRVAGPAFVPGALVHTRVSEFLDTIGSEERPTVAHKDSSTLPRRNAGGRLH